MPSDFINGRAIWQYYLNVVLPDFLNVICSIYLDDILIYSKTLEEHTKQVRAVHQRLRGFGVTCDIRKCEFHVQDTTLLGLFADTGATTQTCLW